ncbi:hypothetical protein ABIB57_000069 [Devosia sp. UYZn731]|uniref:hypothetical protein n=1 Tax=Devosia sp. UYZn731 TaxID=3156345 RepID=UPI003398B815
MLIGATEFCQIVGIDPKRFEVRRQRERASLDVAESLGRPVEDALVLPITPIVTGRHSRFDPLDCVGMRAVIVLEAAGMDFAKAAQFVRSAGLSAFLSHNGQSGDFHFARWTTADGTLSRSFGTKAELANAMPEAPSASIIVNVSSVAAEIAARAADIGLAIDNLTFSRKGKSV